MMTRIEEEASSDVKSTISRQSISSAFKLFKQSINNNNSN
jgi:hypothetical protein